MRGTRPSALRPEAALAAALLAGFVVFPFIGGSSDMFGRILIWGLFGLGFDLLFGYTGLLSFGQAAFYGTGGYVCAWLLTTHTIANVWLALVIGTLAAGVWGMLVGWLALRRIGIYFAMITLALAQMVYFFCVEAPFTHGEDGIQAVPQGKALGLFDLSNPRILYVFVAVVFLFGFLAIQRIVNSPFGEILKAIRENEPRVISLGYRSTQYKLAAFILSAGLAGLAGATKAIVAQNASLTDVAFAMSGEVVLMTLVGGMGTFYGPVVGALIVVAMQNYLAQFGEWVTVIQGVVFVACVLAFPRGIVGELAARAKISL